MKQIEICVWEKYTGKYITSCGHQAHSNGRGWMYCPYCGKFLQISRKRYQELYHKKHKEEHAAYYREYYEENK